MTRHTEHILPRLADRIPDRRRRGTGKGEGTGRAVCDGVTTDPAGYDPYNHSPPGIDGTTSPPDE